MPSMVRRPIRVLRVITRLNVGGPTRHVAFLMNGLGDAFEQVLVHGNCAGHEGSGVLESHFAPLTSHQMIQVPELVREISPQADARVYRTLRRIMQDFAPDIVHTHQAKAGILGRMAARKSGAQRLVHTYHGHTFEGYFGPLRGSVFKTVERYWARRTDALICQSPLQRTDLVHHLGRTVQDRIHEISPAIDVSSEITGSILPGGREAMPSDRVLRLLFPSRLVSIKRPLLALQLGRMMANERPVVVRFLGDGPQLNALKSWAGSRSSDGFRVEFHGWQPSLRPFLQDADLVLMTSRMEGTPLVILESQLLGIPVAAVDVGGVRDILGSFGVLLDPEGDVESWAHQIERGWEGLPTAQEWDERRRFILTHHSPEQLAERMGALYHDLMS